MTSQDGVDHLALDSNSPTVNDSHDFKSTLHGLVEVLLDNHTHLFGLKCVQIYRIFNRQLVHLSRI